VVKRSHSGYIRRLEKFKQGEEGAIKLLGFEPKVFGLFVQFLYHHNCSTVGIIESFFQTRIDTKVWVLSDYLDASEFKDFALCTGSNSPIFQSNLVSSRVDQCGGHRLRLLKFCERFMSGQALQERRYPILARPERSGDQPGQQRHLELDIGEASGFPERRPVSPQSDQGRA
jgi:hypothetical protein